MTEITPGHPAWEELQAYGQGRLAPEATWALEQHLAGCTTCCAQLEQAPCDGFLGQLRDAAAHADRGRSTDTGVATAESAPGIPAELVGHPRYRVLGLLGQGGMGAVYRAEDQRLERPVALKVIHPGLKRHPPLVERFHQEVRAAARLHHANIVTAYDADQAGGLHFLVMEYIEGTSLAELLRARGPLPVAEACDYVRQAALGLQHAHAQGMVHRDIKPQNLMVVAGEGTAAPQLKILDFGLARLRAAPDRAAPAAPAAGPLTAAGVLMGTADYVAPEQAADPRAADIRADIYALGCTLFHLLTGRPPFPDGPVQAKLARHADTPLPPLPDVPPGLAAVLARMTAKEPAGRHATPAEVAEALAPFCQPAGTGPPRRWKRRLFLAAGALLAAGLLAGAAVAHLGTDPGRPAVPSDGQGLEIPIRPNIAPTAQEAEARADAAIQKLGGRILRNGNPESGTIDSVRLAGTKATDADLRELAALPRVRSLDLGGTRVTDAGLKELTGLTRLTDLTLDHTKVTDVGLKYVGGLKQLRVLDLQCTSVGDAGLRHLAGLEQPIVLRLAWTRVTDTGMADVGRWPGLIQLNLDGTAVTDLGLARLAGLTRLTALSLNQAQGVGDEGMKTVRLMPQLQSLDLCHTRVTDRGLKDLAGLTHLNSLRIAGLKVTDTGVEALRPLTALQTLDLSNTAVSDRAMKEVVRHRRLTFLILQSARRLTDAGLKELAGLPRLKTLVLSGTAVTDVGLAELAGLPQLDCLILANTNVSDAGLKELLRCPRLSLLHVMGADRVTAAGVAELQKARPALKILYSGQAGGPS